MGSDDAARIKVSEAESIVRRFNQRVDLAFQRAAPTKDWVHRALHRQGGPRSPVRLRRLSYELILRHGDALAALFDEYPDDVVFAQAYDQFLGYQGTGGTLATSVVDLLTHESEWTDEWDTRWEHAEGGPGASPSGHPIGDWTQLDAYLATRMPDPNAAGRLDGAAAALRLHGSTKYVVGMTHNAMFERLHFLRGMENAFEDLYVSPTEVGRLLDALTEYHVELVRAWGRLPGVDAVFLTDDWGTQSAMMISPGKWRTLFFPRYRRLCDAAHASGLDVVFHSCGHVSEIIGDLIDAGVDVIDPLQPEAMDLNQVAREFGGKVAFAGGLSDQMLASYSPAQVRDEVRRALDTLGAPFGNAYMIAPSNLMMPDIPLANLEALFEACHDQ